jgi:hypothetical protein
LIRESVFADDSPVPEGLEEYVGADNDATYLYLERHLPVLTLDALMPMEEKEILHWLWHGRCPQYGAKGNRRSRATTAVERQGNLLEVKCISQQESSLYSSHKGGCGHVRHYKLLLEAQKG